MNVVETAISNLLILEHRVFGDDRDFFMESFNSRTFGELTGLDVNFVQDNQSRSSRSGQADFLYKTMDYYAPDHERCIKWDDSSIGIDWPVDSTSIVSEKDLQGVSFQNAEVFP